MVLVGTLGVVGHACGGDDGGGSHGGSGGGTGGTGAGGTGTGGATCGPTSPDFPGSCKPGALEECCSDTLPVMKRRDKNDNLVDPDWSCIGIGAAGAGGTGMGGTGGTTDGGTTDGGTTDGGTTDAAGPKNIFQLVDFSNDQPIGDVEVELYEGESIFGKTPFIQATTKGVTTTGDPGLNVGEFYFDHPSSPFISYRVKEKPDVCKAFVGFGYDVPPAPGKVKGNTLTPNLYLELASFAVPIAGWEPPTDLAIVTGPIRDCAGNDVGGARIKFIDEATETEVQPGTCDRDVRYIYFDGSYPNPKCTYTDWKQSLWLIVNARANEPGTPGEGKKYRVEYWGRLRDSDTASVKFAQKSVEIVQNTVNVHEIRPNIQQK
jgi:hypothetical protein